MLTVNTNRILKNFRLTDSEVNWLKQIAGHYQATETKIIQAMIKKEAQELGLTSDAVVE